MPSKMPRNATLSVVTVYVLCPYCGEPQPSPADGSHQWIPTEIKMALAKGERRECVSCDATYRLNGANTAQVFY